VSVRCYAAEKEMRSYSILYERIISSGANLIEDLAVGRLIQLSRVHAGYNMPGSLPCLQ
jgi:hypothetical protein